MTEFYADYIKKTTFDPETNSVRSKLEEAATKDYKKNQHTSTPKMEVKPTEIPEGHMECPDCKGEGCEKCDDKGHISEKLHGDQHRLDHNKDMKITASDMKMVRKKGAVKDHPAEDTADEAMIIRSKKPISNLRRSSASRPAGVKEDELEEATFRVSVAGLPQMHITGSSAGEIKTSLRKMLKDPKALGSIEKITPSEKKSDLRAKMTEEEQVDEAVLLEFTRVAMKAAKEAISKGMNHDDAQRHVEKAVYTHSDKVGMQGADGRVSRARENNALDKADAHLAKHYGKNEQVAELSKKTIGSYINKASQDASNQMATAGYHQGKEYDHSQDVIDKAAGRVNKRMAGIQRATKKLTKEGAMKRMATQDNEQVDELSKQTLGSYVKKATADVDDKAYTQGQHDASGIDSNYNRTLNKRRAGINKAVDKMTNEGAMKRMATQDAEKERLGPKKATGDGMETFKKKPMGEKFANAAQQAAVMADIKASGKYKKPKESVEEKDTHVTKDGRTVKKGLWYYMNKRKKAGTSRPASAGTVSPEAMKKSQSKD